MKVGKSDTIVIFFVFFISPLTLTSSAISSVSSALEKSVTANQYKVIRTYLYTVMKHVYMSSWSGLFQEVSSPSTEQEESLNGLMRVKIMCMIWTLHSPDLNPDEQL